MKRLLLVPALLAAACDHSPSFRGEGYRAYYAPKSESYEEQKVDQKKIMSWKDNPRQKRLVGWFEEWRIKPRGTRDWETMYHIYDARGVTLTGFITETGVFYRFGRDGRKERVGEWTVIPTGLKVFLGLPLNSNLDFEEIDPYGD